VYLTYSHDVIDDGWMTSLVRSDVFAQLDHRRLMKELAVDVRTLYARHFASRRMLLPLYAQEYLGNLMYLAFHQAAPPRFSLDELGIPEYEFDGSLPDYDVERGVHAGYQASDQLAKDRWLVKPLDDCLNLKGLASTVAILKKERSPVLLLILPVNRRFYAFNGLDMAEFERRYQALRGAIRRFEEPGHIFVVDFYEAPWLKLGFADRMHADANGFHQMAAHLRDDPTYARFRDAVRAYYANPSVGGGSPVR
jgi:DltD protein